MSTVALPTSKRTGSEARPDHLPRPVPRIGVGTATTMIAAASTCFGLVVFFARSLTDAGIAPSAVAFYRYAIGGLVLLPRLRLDRPHRSATAWALAAGLGMGLGWIAYVEAIEEVEVSTAGVVYMTYPMFAVAAAWVVFGQRPTHRAIVGALLVVVAAGVALSPASVGSGDLDELLVALAAPVTFGFTIAVLTERLAGLAPLERIAGVSVGALVGLSPLLVGLSRDEVVPSESRGWLVIVGVGLFTALLPQLAYSIAAPLVGPARTATAGALELPTIFAIGWLAFGESIGAPQLLAGALVITAVVVSPSRTPPATVATLDVPGEPRGR